ncbi:MAG TPA: virion morphogenesis protein [Porphyromonadaceae bacterium]|nr:virion morphogenesis protein [Porphyromonadaceae bacterium]
MDINEFNRRFTSKMDKIKEFASGDDIKNIVGVEAVNHYKKSFADEGFTDKVLNPWKDVKRRNPDSSWYGHSGQTGRFSQARTTAPVLSGETRELQNSITFRRTDRGVRISNDKPYAHVHNYGGRAKIYGKKEFQMPQRRFVGRSAVLIGNINTKIKKEFTRILKDN